MPFDKSLLRECPTLHPTETEFGSPIEYLSRAEVCALGAEFGLIKVVPPPGWKPPFSLAPSFLFHTRTQKLGDLGLCNRSRMFFVESMNRFMQMSGLKPRNSWLSGYLKPIHTYDLYLAFKELFPAVEDLSTLTLEDALRLNRKMGVDACGWRLLHSFKEVLWPYAQFLARNGDNFDFPTNLTDNPDCCIVCGKSHSPTTMLMCDNCDDAYHMKCLVPALETVPDGTWYCDRCLVGSGEYGFEENPELRYNLWEFVQDCQNFERDFYKVHGVEGTPLSVEKIERIFWRRVEEGTSDVKVKYGADIHNSTNGEMSGFPTADYPPLSSGRSREVEQYARHPWNLTQLPFAKGSLLNQIQRQISGMTVPWIYVGSLLSTFCWHVEDHYTLSANYCHFGNMKTWYGIPSAYADKFEDHMRQLAPDLFQRQPDLLHQLVTLISPSDLAQVGIPVVSTRQGPNEFVVTFPRVYHAGFNCGFNLNEAVNFSMDSWLPIGEKAVEDYRSIRKENVFDHYKLIEDILRSFERDGPGEWRGRGELIEQCLSSFSAFVQRQASLLGRLKSDRFSEKHMCTRLAHPASPITPKDEAEALLVPTDAEQKSGLKAVANDNNDKLCDICRTFLSHQYCLINNRNHRFGNWYKGRPKKIPMTPEESPYAEQRTVTDEAVEIVWKESGARLQQVSGLSPEIKTESNLYTEHVRPKRKLSEAAAQGAKKQRNLRNSAIKEPPRPQERAVKEETPPAQPTSKTPINSIFRELNRLDILRLCLQCTANECGENGERVPRFSEIVYERELEDMVAVVSSARARLKQYASESGEASGGEVSGAEAIGTACL